MVFLLLSFDMDHMDFHNKKFSIGIFDSSSYFGRNDYKYSNFKL